MESGYLSFQRSTIHYLKSGQANKPLIAFHGYGESASNFNFLSGQLKDHFTLIAIDLPFHGETAWAEGALDAMQVRSIVLAIIKKENLSGEHISVIGFSLGGRIALSLYETMPELIDRIVLLAPDGLKLNFWYWLSTQTAIGNKAFAFTMRHPTWFLGMLRIGNRLKIINRSIYKFVEYYIHDELVRQELFNRWTCLRKCKPNLQQIRSSVIQQHTLIRLLYGKHDRIILPSRAYAFIEKVKTAKLELLDCGHQVLHSKNVDQIVEALIS